MLFAVDVVYLLLTLLQDGQPYSWTPEMENSKAEGEVEGQVEGGIPPPPETETSRPNEARP